MLVKIRKPRDWHEAILLRAGAFSHSGRNNKHPLMLSFLLLITFPYLPAIVIHVTFHNLAS